MRTKYKILLVCWVVFLIISLGCLSLVLINWQYFQGILTTNCTMDSVTNATEFMVFNKTDNSTTFLYLSCEECIVISELLISKFNETHNQMETLSKDAAIAICDSGIAKKSNHTGIKCVEQVEEIFLRKNVTKVTSSQESMSSFILDLESSCSNCEMTED